ncbi:MAG: DEAD/DEAH box helicase [Flavobacteriales bacterium]
MSTFNKFNLSKQLIRAIEDLGFTTPTPVQEEAYSVILSGKDVVGISQTGTGKTLAFVLPLLQDLKFSKQIHPRILILVPTIELVTQTVEKIESYAKYVNVRVLGIHGGDNINTQKIQAAEGTDIVVATPGRLYDLSLNSSLQLKSVKKLVIDEVDIMLDLGFRFQLTNIFELLPERRQNIMFSATMTEEVDELINDFFIAPTKISIAVSGTPLNNILQQCYSVKNFFTKVNLLKHLLEDETTYSKVVVFVSSKKHADRVFELLNEEFGKGVSVMHSNKTQNYRAKAIEQFDSGKSRILVATDVIARGLDLNEITHVINFDTPIYAENYMHRIGRTGRAEKQGNSILFYTEKEKPLKEAIETLMSYQIPEMEFPKEVEITLQLLAEEEPKNKENFNKNLKLAEHGEGFHEKKEKNKKVNLGGSYRRTLAKKYKKPKTKGDKNYNKKKRRM